MTTEIEISTLDLRYEGYRVRDPRHEQKLQAQILARGIENPLAGIDRPSGKVLLDGFKRYRCARKLKIELIPYVSVGENDASGILTILKEPAQKRMGILEEAQFLRELQSEHGMSIAELACSLSRSKGWVSMRLNLLNGLSDTVYEKIFSGAFPAYCYMYILRKFMRMNEGSSDLAEEFVKAVSGEKFSLRELEKLACGFFKGGKNLRREIAAGNADAVLGRMERVAKQLDGCTSRERSCLNELGRMQKLMETLIGRSNDPALESADFKAEAHILQTGIVSRTKVFEEAMRRFYDRCGDA